VKGMLGTTPFMPPEAFLGVEYDPRPVDIWAMAIMYAQMALPTVPWRSKMGIDDDFALFTPEAVEKQLVGRETRSVVNGKSQQQRVIGTSADEYDEL
jgi:serine/threonine protein kinase